MKIPQFILGAALTVLIGVETWTLVSLIELKVSVATLTQRVDDALPKLSSNPPALASR